MDASALGGAACSPGVAQRRFRAMGSNAHVVVHAEPQRCARILDAAAARLAQLEQRWSRFIPTSEIAQLSAGGGVHQVSADTALLVRLGVEAWQRTAGRFDPTVYRAMLANGYDQTFDQLELASHQHGERPTPSPGCLGIVVDEDQSRVAMPEGVGFDPGGIGKGLAADIVASEAIAAGARGAMVNVGGDLRTVGCPPASRGWGIAISEPTVQDSPIAQVAFENGAMATSTSQKRRWDTQDGARHHLLDPRTGLPHQGPVVLATVIAAEAWWAEALTKQLFGTDPRDAENLLHGAPALLVTEDGSRHLVGGMEDYIVSIQKEAQR